MRVLIVISTCLLAVALANTIRNRRDADEGDNAPGWYVNPDDGSDTTDHSNNGNHYGQDASHKYNQRKRPNVILIVADDLGWNDVGFNGSPDVKTPNLDALAASGVTLGNYYVQPVCTPSRVQLLSGVHEVNVGLCHEVIHTGQRNALNISLPTLADKLKEADYDTHLIGKWNLGHYQAQFAPTQRGFDTFFGYLNALTDHYSHGGYERFNSPPTAPQTPPFGHTFNGHDFWINDQQDGHLYDGQYTTHLYTSRAQDIINAAGAQNGNPNPFFIDLSFSAPHWPLSVPDKYLAPYADPSSPQYIADLNRRTYAAMMSCLDEGVGNITATLQANKKIWDNTVIIFTTDNGGVDNFGGNNFPLRGKKQTFWEGGLRGVAFVAGPKISKKVRGTRSSAFLHISDWYPTILNLARGDTGGQTNLYGFDVWDVINGNAASQRFEILHGIDNKQPAGLGTPSAVFDTVHNSGALRQGDWKIVFGAALDGNWYNSPSQDLASGPGGRALIQRGPHPPNDQIIGQQNLTLGYAVRPHIGGPTQNVWLFNIASDPQEIFDLSGSSLYADRINDMLQRVADLQAQGAPCRFPPMDLNADPASYGGNFQPWVAADGTPPPRFV